MTKYNKYLREQKEEGIKEAIKQLINQGVLKPTNKQISERTKSLFERDALKIVSTQTLSNQYYKKNIPKWIIVISGGENGNLEKARKAALASIQIKTQKKRKLCIKYCIELVNLINNGDVLPNKAIPTKNFVKEWFMNNKGIRLYLSMQDSWIYEYFLTEFQLSVRVQEDINIKDDKNICRLRKNFSRVEAELNQLLIGGFVNSESRSSDPLLNYGDGLSNFINVNLNRKQLDHFFNNNFKELYQHQDSINAYKLITEIIKVCKV